MNAVPHYSASTSRAPATRVLPHNLNAEASVLGGVILRNETLAQLDHLEVDHFYDHRHKVVFQAMRSLEAAIRPIDVVTLEVEIERTGKLDAIGGVGFLGELALRVPTPDNFLTYAKTVVDQALLRSLALKAADIIERVYRAQEDDEADEIIAQARVDIEHIDKLARDPNAVRLITIPQALAELEELAKAPVYPTPYGTLNDAIGFGGFLGTQVYTVAAGTGRGKTSWVSDVAAHAAGSVPVLVASWEMRPGYFVARKAAGVLGVHSNDILRGVVPFRTVTAAMPYGRFFMLHKPTLSELRRAVDRIAQKFGQAPLVVVDYIQKLADFIARGMNRPDLRLATSEASEALCEIADSTTSAIVAVSAIGRGNNKRASQPRKCEPYELVDVAKESGSVEYDGAGLIVLSLDKETDGEERVATMTLAKARFGSEIHIDARYNGRRGSWRDLGRLDTGAATAPSASNEDIVLRQKIATSAVEKPGLSASDFVQRFKGQKGARRQDVLATVKSMLTEGLLFKNSNLPGEGISVSEMGRDLLPNGGS